ncbi:hypothetical protein BJV77DRAFT_493320 [Russula vinacea]|nr:hypothetical protein BJV77DRAFT_493320 [Russula vinacea]
MDYQWSGSVHTRQYRAATAPTPSQPPFPPAIPPSLIPGRRSLSATGTVTNRLLYSGPDHPSVVSAAITPVADGTQFYSLNPSRYLDMQPPPPPLPLPQSLLPQSVVPPLPPKTPFKVSPMASPTLPAKPPPPLVPSHLLSFDPQCPGPRPSHPLRCHTLHHPLNMCHLCYRQSLWRHVLLRYNQMSRPERIPASSREGHQILMILPNRPCLLQTRLQGVHLDSFP